MSHNNIKVLALDAYIAHMENILNQATKGFETAKQDSIEAEGTMQSRYSTFKEEAQYRMVGFAKQIDTIESKILHIKKVRQVVEKEDLKFERALLLSLVTVETIDDGKQQTYLLISGGDNFTYQNILILGIDTPVGISLFGKEEGDEAIIKKPSGNLPVEIISIK